ncbi:MAG: hypothetical protein Q9M25_07180 [Mariprofundaceae bacterium]|nr:hypothetical protein [Mariprofundaceae bacterium]
MESLSASPGVIYQALLQGAKGESDFRQLREYLQTHKFYHPLDALESHAGAARICFDCRRKGLRFFRPLIASSSRLHWSMT